MGFGAWGEEAAPWVPKVPEAPHLCRGCCRWPWGPYPCGEAPTVVPVPHKEGAVAVTKLHRVLGTG